MIVNASDTLQLWTDNLLRAGVHQVTVPRDVKHRDDAMVPERFSMAFFL